MTNINSVNATTFVNRSGPPTHGDSQRRPPETAGTRSNTDETVRLSQQGQLLASAGPLLNPTAETVRQLSAALSEELGKIFRASAIDRLPPVETDVDEVSGEVRLRGDRADKDRISALIDANPEVKRRIRDIAAIGSHAIHMPEQLQFQHEYRAASAPTAVVAKYSRLFGPQESLP